MKLPEKVMEYSSVKYEINKDIQYLWTICFFIQYGGRNSVFQ